MVRDAWVLVAVERFKEDLWHSSDPAGKQRRLARLFRHSDGRAVILAIDDGLISGPGSAAHFPIYATLFERHRIKLCPTGYCCSPGVLEKRALVERSARAAAIVNVTASTKHAVTLLVQVLCTDVEAAVAAGCRRQWQCT